MALLGVDVLVWIYWIVAAIAFFMGYVVGAALGYNKGYDTASYQHQRYENREYEDPYRHR